MRITRFIPVLALAAFLAVSCQQRRQPATGTVSRVTNPISVDSAREYVARYGRDRVDSMGLPDPHGKPIATLSTDTRCIWYSIEELESILQEVKDASKGSSRPINGIRFYFATYDSSYKDNKFVKEEYWNRTTLRLVSTVLDTIAGQPVNMDFFKDAKREGLLRIGGVANHGEMCPPPPDCKAIGARLLQ